MGGAFTRRDRVIYRGDISVTLISGPQTVVFPQPMPGDYDIYIAVPQSGLMVTSTTNKTLAGFTMALTISLAATLTWVAVEKM